MSATASQITSGSIVCSTICSGADQHQMALLGPLLWHLMMTSSNGNIFRVTGPLWGEFTGHQWRGALIISLIYAWTNGWANHRDTGGLRRHRAHYDMPVNESTYTRQYSSDYQWLGHTINATCTVFSVILVASMTCPMSHSEYCFGWNTG